MKVKVMLIAVILIMVACSSLAEDWPQWQGPNRDGKSADTGLLKEWPNDGPSLAWRSENRGGGDSAPSIASGRIYGMGNRGDEEVVWALSEKDGSEIWATPLGPAFQQRSAQGREGPGCTPTVDGERLYVEGLGGNVACLQVNDGKIIWQISMTEEFGGRVPNWSYRESPLIDGDKVICTPGGEEATLVALDKLTGTLIWKGIASSSSEAGPADPGGLPSNYGGAPGGVGRGRGGPGASAGDSTAAVTGTSEPGLFNSEHFSMTAFSCKIPNGKYLAKLYFAETYDGITGPGQRVFDFNVQGHEIKDFDAWAKTGGPRRAYIETVPVEVANGEFRVAFTPKVENPAINAIEIIPQEGAVSSEATVRINAGSSEQFTDSSGNVWQPDSGFEGGMTSQISGGTRRWNFDDVGRGDFGGGPGGFGSEQDDSGSSDSEGSDSEPAYSSVIAFDFEGQRQYVQLLSNTLAGFAASDGEFLWRYDPVANSTGINCSTPIYHDGHVFASSAYEGGAALVKLSRDSDGSVKAEEVYRTTDMQNHHGGVILLDGYLYGANGGNGGGALVCLDFETGKVMWDQRQSAGSRAKGSLALADGLLYYRMEDGTVILIEPSPKQYIELGRFEQPDRRSPPAWAHPVIANGRLYIRDQDVLFCYDVKTK